MLHLQIFKSQLYFIKTYYVQCKKSKINIKTNFSSRGNNNKKAIIKKQKQSFYVVSSSEVRTMKM